MVRVKSDGLASTIGRCALIFIIKFAIVCFFNAKYKRVFFCGNVCVDLTAAVILRNSFVASPGADFEARRSAAVEELRRMNPRRCQIGVTCHTSISDIAFKDHRLIQVVKDGG